VSRGRRSLTDEQEEDLVRRARLRDNLTDKALAREFGISERGVRSVLARWRHRQVPEPIPNLVEFTECIPP
jgi:hypothetical protein